MEFSTFDRMSPDRLAELIEAFGRLRVAVVGDFFLDKYLDIEPSLAEVSVETGKTAHQVIAVRHSPGAAGTVVCNLEALGAGTLHAVGLTGEDGEGYELRQDLAALDCGSKHLHADPDRMTPTYLKPRDCGDASLAGEHSRYDTKNRTPTSRETEQRIIQSIESLLPQIDAMIILDQVAELDCGVVTTAIRNHLADAASRYANVVFWADSRCRIRSFRRVLVKANQFEVVDRENRPDDEVALNELVAAIPALRARTGAPVYVTRGSAGMIVSDGQPVLVPGVRVEGPLDPTCAGDSATAGAVLALAAGASLPEAALLGNLVASITIQQLATTGTAKPEQLAPRLALWQSQRQ